MSDSQEFDDHALDLLRRIGKGKLLGSMATLFENNAPARMSAMRTAVQAGNAAEAARAAHSLKSSAGQLGAVALQRICAEIETAAESGDVLRAEALVSTAEPILTRALAWTKSRVQEEKSAECQKSQ